MRIRRFLATVLFGALALRASTSAQTPTCDGPGFVAPDANPAPFLNSLTAAEMTGDAYIDLVGISSDSFVVLPGLPDGSFGTVLASPLGEFPQAYATGDFSGDGILDVAVVYVFGQLQVALGNGDGTLQPPVSVGFASGFLAAANLDGNDLADIIVSSGNLVTVFLSQGGGVFSEPVATPIWASAPMVLGDLNGDGLPDLVGPRPPAGGQPGETVFYPGRGDGAFDPSIKISDGDSRSVVIADFTGDGNLDVAAVRGFRVGVAVGHGNGLFDPEVFTDTPVPYSIQTANLNGDAYPDLLVKMTDEFYQSLGPLRVLVGKGDGTFRPDLSYAIGSSFYEAAAADFGLPDHEDVAVTGFEAGAVGILRGNGDGTLRGPTEIGLFYNNFVQSVASGDFNEDGYADLADIFGGSVLGFEFGGPQGRFTGGGTISPGGTLTGLAAADFNNDSHLDLATLSTSGDTVAVFLGHGDGTFSIASNTPTPASFYSTLLAADLDGDGALDIVTMDRDPNVTADTIGILLGHGDATFEPRPAISLGLATNGMTAADLDGDGLLDLAVTGALPGNSYPGTLFVLHGLGNGLFAAPATYTTGIAPGPVRAANILGSPALDLVVGHLSDAPLLIYPGNGDGTFAEPAGVGTGGGVANFVVGDFQLDGHADILTLGYPRLNLLYGNGNGVFTLPLSYQTGGSFAALLLADDFDGNGTPDAITSWSGGYLSGIDLLLNAHLAVRVPDPGIVHPGEKATLVANGSGLGFVAYQWRKDGVQLSDGGTISGATTATLTIDPVSFDDPGSYDVVVTDDCGEITSSAVAFAVEFADVPDSSPFHDDIITIATEGITGGCGGGNYCPTLPVRRDQMAVFLLKAEHGSSYTPPDCSGVFPDVPCPGPFTNWVEQLAAEGVTSGCGGGNYCPSQSVTRAQMAIFLLKTKDGSAYTPPAATGIFGDVPPGSFGADFIEELYNRGITGGCSTSPLLYCPTTPVLRQQMATFLVRTFAP